MSPESVLAKIRGVALVISTDGTILDAYGGESTLGGHAITELPGRHALELLDEGSHEAMLGVFMPDESVPTVPSPTSFPVRLVAPDGALVDVDVLPTGFDDEDGRGWVVLVTSRAHLPPAASVLYSMRHGSSLSDTMQGIVDRMSRDVPEMPDVVRTSIAVLRPGSNEADCLVSRSCATSRVVAALVEQGDESLWSWFDDESIVSTPVDLLPAELRAAMSEDGLSQLLAFRTVGGGRTTCAVLYFVTDPNPDGLLGNTLLAFEELRLAISRVIEQDEGRRALEEAASRDPLTGLYNRAGFERSSQSASRDSSIIYVDLDNFKAINDNYGHGVGDGVLAEVAARLRSACRPHDRIARLGGDEFAIVISGVGPKRTESIAHRLRESISTPLPHSLGPEVITASIGIAEVSADDELADAVTAADLAMLAAKRAGRDRIARA